MPSRYPALRDRSHPQIFHRGRHWVHTTVASAATIAVAATLGLAGPLAATAAPSTPNDTAAPNASTAPTQNVPPIVGTPLGDGQPHSITYDHSSVKIDGNRVYLWSGEFHYYRLPNQQLWRDVLEKIRAAGFNAVSLYFDWGYHSPQPGVYDFSGVRDVDKLLDIADDLGMYVIARPGPYINAEVDGGGFPTWLSSRPGATRTNDPDYQKYADEWQGQIDAILARHQLSDGGGSIILYQVENEYYNGSATSRAYMQHIEDKAVADGITVPLIGNNNGTFSSGDAALDIDFADSYPQGFNCSNPSHWNGVPGITYDHAAGKPLGVAEFQGGAFDPWGGPGYDKCAQLINDQFADVFYKSNIAQGATLQNFYMTYGGTSWGFLSEPQNYTSYDYGAAIRETRQFDGKYYEDKRLGYLTQDVPALRDTGTISSGELSSSAMLDSARLNPDTSTQFHILRHNDSTSTSKDSGTLTVDTGAKIGYTYDDVDDALEYTGGGWQSDNADTVQWTGGDYKQTETYSATAGDYVTIPFHGTGVTWITSKDANHGTADVYLDGDKVTTVDTYAGDKVVQDAIYQVTDLPEGDHTLKIVVTGEQNAHAEGTNVAIDAIDVQTGPAPEEYTIPQEPDTSITLDGRESKILLVNAALGSHHMVYSTSELMSTLTTGGRDLAVLYGAHGSDGETLLHFDSEPAIDAPDGVTSTWDSDEGTLRLNYTHDGLARVSITGGGSSAPLLLLLADKQATKNIWQQQTSDGPILVIGSHLLRGAEVEGTTLALTGDNLDESGIEIFSSQSAATWNGKAVATSPTDATHGAVGQIATAEDVTLPELSNWKHQEGAPEARAKFDDTTWIVADHMSTNSITAPASYPVLFADDYGFHTGSTWYRGHFIATGSEDSITLTTQSGGGAAAASAWLNGTFLGSTTSDGAHDYTVPKDALQPGEDNVISVLTVNMGHEEDYNAASGNKAARGLLGASVTGKPMEAITWRVQGVRGGEDLVDTVRGPLALGGLYGERAGWYTPGYDTSGWNNVTLPTSDSTPGVSWYSTNVDLALPTGQDTSVGVEINDDDSRQYRAEIFVNGWEIGNYVNYLGPQTSFPIPNGIIHTDGENNLKIAVWNLDGNSGGLGDVKLVNYGSPTSSLRVLPNDTFDYAPTTFAMPAAAQSTVDLRVPGAVSPDEDFTASATISIPKDAHAASDISATLTAPSGWTVGAASVATIDAIGSGGRATVSWPVTAPHTLGDKPSLLTVDATGTQGAGTMAAQGKRVIGVRPAPPGSGTIAVSDLPFLSASNGWGPVERDMSVGEQAAGDGSTIQIDGEKFTKGLGTNSPSTVSVYLGGQCQSFTATVGVDDDRGNSGTVTFAVLVDGETITSTGVLHGGGGSQDLTADVTGGQVLSLVVGEGGDDNGNDHGDWGAPTLTCNGEFPAIASVDDVAAVQVPRGTSAADALAALPRVGTVSDQYGRSHDVAYDWALTPGYDGSMVGSYAATATFDLPYGLVQSDPATTLSVTGTIEVQPATAAVSLGSDHVAGGTRVGIAATGFDPGEQVEVTIKPDDLASGTWRASPLGAVHGTLLIPGGTDPGDYTVRLVGASSQTTAKADLTVEKTATAITTPVFSATSQIADGKKKDRAWATTTVMGTDSGTVDFREGGKTVATAPVKDGVARVRLPRTLTVGHHQLVAELEATSSTESATSQASITFTVKQATLKKLKVKATKKVRKKGFVPHHKVKVKVKISKKLTNRRKPHGKVKVKVGKKKITKISAKKLRKHKVKIKIPKRYVHGKKLKVKAIFKPADKQMVGKKKTKVVLKRR